MSHYECSDCHKRYDDCRCDFQPKIKPEELLKTITESMTENPWSDELSNEFTVVVSGDWIDEGKAEGKTDIVRHDASGLLFQIESSRTGDYWQGYETEFITVFQVESYREIITAYRAVEAVISE